MNRAAGTVEGGWSLGTAKSLDRFLASVEKRAYKMALVATGQREDALDIVQEAMFKLAHKYSKRDPEEWPPLFYRVLQSRIRDWYRRNRVNRKWFRQFFVHDGDEGVNELDNVSAHAGNEPEQRMAGQTAVTMIDQALHALPLRQQQCVLLRLWEGLDVKQTAAVMGCSEGSVKTHYSRAVHTLRDKLEGYWP